MGKMKSMRILFFLSVMPHGVMVGFKKSF